MRLTWTAVGERYTAGPYTVMPRKNGGYDAYLADYKKPTGYQLTRSDRVYTLQSAKRTCQQTENEAESTLD